MVSCLEFEGGYEGWLHLFDPTPKGKESQMTMKKTVTFLLIVSVCVTLLNLQAMSIWGPCAVYGEDLPLASGGVSGEGGDTRMLSDVRFEWMKSYKGESTVEDVPKAMAVDASGNVYVTGYSKTNVSNSDYVTIKYDSGQAITTDSSGNVYVTGKSFSPDSGWDYLTIKYSQP